MQVYNEELHHWLPSSMDAISSVLDGLTPVQVIQLHEKLLSAYEKYIESKGKYKPDIDEEIWGMYLSLGCEVDFPGSTDDLQRSLYGESQYNLWLKVFNSYGTEEFDTYKDLYEMMNRERDLESQIRYCWNNRVKASKQEYKAKVKKSEVKLFRLI